VLYIDADHFKDINDTFGHKAGDAVLRMVGQSLVNGLRRGDIPVRWGGEEFLALLPGSDEAGLAADRRAGSDAGGELLDPEW
jgi:diguanylate cyclase (GGDEF)-like protein